MPRIKKHKNDLNDFLRYSGKEMKGKERNAFEKRLQKDAFDEEAAEGFSMISPEEAKKDLHEITRRLKQNKKRILPVAFLRVAAVVALLLATALILTIVRPDEKPSLVSENVAPAYEEKPFIIPASEGIHEPVSESKKVQPVSRALSVEKKELAYTAAVVVDTVAVSALTTRKDIAYVAEAAIEEENEDRMLVVQAMPEFGKKEASRRRKIEGKVISTEDNLPLPGVSVVVKGTAKGAVSDVEGRFSIDVDTESDIKLIAQFIGMETQELTSRADTELLIAMNTSNATLDEVIITGSGTSKSKNAVGAVQEITLNEEVSGTYTPPVPATGDEAFSQYVKKNLIYPPSALERTKEVVVVSMIVRSDGTIDRLRVLKSPGMAFSDEAIRLIKEGPKWNPSTLNGQPQDDEVKIRIVFK